MRTGRRCILLAVLGLGSLLGLTAGLLAQDGIGPDAGNDPDQPVAVKRLPNGDVEMGGITLHRKTMELSFPAVFNLGYGSLEVLIATPVGRLHESLFRAPIKALHLQTMLYLLNLKNGPRSAAETGNQGAIVDIDVEWSRADGTTVREAIEEWVTDAHAEGPMKRVGWVFVGSSIAEGEFTADAAGNLALLYSLGDTILDMPHEAGDDDTVFAVNEKKKAPGNGADVRIIITPRDPPPEPND